jgi:hypothetical protein
VKILDEKKHSLENRTIDFNNVKGLIQALVTEQREIENLIENSDFAIRLRKLQKSLEDNQKENSIRENNFRNYKSYLDIL